MDSEDSRLCSVYRGTGRLARGESREQTAAPYLRRSQAGDYDRDFYMMVIISMLWRWWWWWFALIAELDLRRSWTDLGGDENYKFVVGGDVDTAENDDDHQALR